MVRPPPRSTLFPSRRSSDLGYTSRLPIARSSTSSAPSGSCSAPISRCSTPAEQREIRSEEHTSELQSQSNLVCRLLLEKKKKKHNTRTNPHTNMDSSSNSSQ